MNKENTPKKPSRKKYPLVWWKDRISTLKGITEETKLLIETHSANLEEISEKEAFGEWTFLKLLTLAYYLDVYTNIAKEHFNKIYYIDICAGEGLVKIRRINEIIAGSALLGNIVPKENKKFDDLFLLEICEIKAERLKQLLPLAKVINNDANDKTSLAILNDFIEEDKRNHFLGFIDPRCMEIDWETVEYLLKKDGDLIINFMYSPIARIWGTYHSSKKTDSDREIKKASLNRFFGDESWLKVPAKDKGGSMDQLLQIYLDKIGKFREIVIPIAIRGLKGLFSYYMIVAIKKTGGAQRWNNAVFTVKSYVEKANDKFVQNLFSIYNGKQKTLERFFS